MEPLKGHGDVKKKSMGVKIIFQCFCVHSPKIVSLKKNCASLPKVLHSPKKLCILSQNYYISLKYVGFSCKIYEIEFPTTSYISTAKVLSENKVSWGNAIILRGEQSFSAKCKSLARKRKALKFNLYSYLSIFYHHHVSLEVPHCNNYCHNKY